MSNEEHHDSSDVWQKILSRFLTTLNDEKLPVDIGALKEVLLQPSITEPAVRKALFPDETGQ